MSYSSTNITHLTKNNRDSVLKRLPAGGYHVGNRCIIEAIPFCASMPEQQPLEYLDSFVGQRALRYPSLQLLAFSEDELLSFKTFMGSKQTLRTNSSFLRSESKPVALNYTCCCHANMLALLTLHFAL